MELVAVKGPLPRLNILGASPPAIGKSQGQVSNFQNRVENHCRLNKQMDGGPDNPGLMATYRNSSLKPRSTGSVLIGVQDSCRRAADNMGTNPLKKLQFTGEVF
jgi:hypothetical protein